VGEVEIAKLNGLRECTILRRVNRFVVECLEGGRTIELHLRNTGRLNKLLVRGFKALYWPKLGGRTLGHLVAVETEGGYAIVDTAVQMSLFETAIERNVFHGLEGFKIGGRNVRYASSRFDYLLKKQALELVLELKSATHVDGSVAMYPDAPTERGRRHVTELAHLAERGLRVALCFLAAHPRAESFRVFREVDEGLYRAVLRAVESGVDVMALKMAMGKDLTIYARPDSLPIIWP
jgi:sugar fermentation stimulation protein A